MEPYRTIFPIKASNSCLSYKTPAFFIGSCFTESIGKKLADLKFPADINPFGVIYNPWSVKNSMEVLIREKEFTKDDLYHYDNQWLSFYHQTSFSHPDHQTCLNTINKGIRDSSKFLKTADFLFVTLGTARVFEWKETGQVVSNCHKIPDEKFNRRLLSIEEIVRVFSDLMDELKGFNPDLKIVFTVSPIRHWKDGAVGNNISKATLLLAIQNLMEKYPETGYFPAFEIVMDDLRDYRFYTEDMIHLNQIAIDYIWEKFKGSFFDVETNSIVKEVNKVLLAYSHRPVRSDSGSHKIFLTQNLEVVRQLQKKYQFLDFTREIDYFSGKGSKD